MQFASLFAAYGVDRPASVGAWWNRIAMAWSGRQMSAGASISALCIGVSLRHSVRDDDTCMHHAFYRLSRSPWGAVLGEAMGGVEGGEVGAAKRHPAVACRSPGEIRRADAPPGGPMVSDGHGSTATVQRAERATSARKSRRGREWAGASRRPSGPSRHLLGAQVVSRTRSSGLTRTRMSAGGRPATTSSRVRAARRPTSCWPFHTEVRPGDQTEASSMSS